MEEIFEQAGFTGKYRKESENFYRQFFRTTEEMLDFFLTIFKRNASDNRPRQMMNQIRRFVSLANDIELIRPGRDPLRILFLRICLESLCFLSGEKNKKIFFEKFERCVSPEGQKYILDHFSFDDIEPYCVPQNQEQSLLDDCSWYTLTMRDFWNITRCIRNIVVHDGDYWSMQVFARDSEYTCLAVITTDENVISCCKPTKNQPITYYFRSALLYEKFVFYFADGCIRYLKNYLSAQE